MKNTAPAGLDGGRWSSICRMTVRVVQFPVPGRRAVLAIASGSAAAARRFLLLYPILVFLSSAV